MAFVILLRPCFNAFEQMRHIVTSDVRPEHVPGSAPEQDFLSRFFAVSATQWHHVAVCYILQLHHVLFVLEAIA